MGELFKVGQKVRDRVTGFTGTITCRSEYITGLPRVTLQALIDGKVVEYYVDEARLELVVEG